MCEAATSAVLASAAATAVADPGGARSIASPSLVRGLMLVFLFQKTVFFFGPFSHFGRCFVGGGSRGVDSLFFEYERERDAARS